MTEMIKICFLYGTTANFPKITGSFPVPPKPPPQAAKISVQKQTGRLGALHKAFCLQTYI